MVIHQSPPNLITIVGWQTKWIQSMTKPFLPPSNLVVIVK
jgi:hypothetical protein